MMGMFSGWESPEVFYAAMAGMARDYSERIAVERLTVRQPDGSVTVVMGLDGFLVTVDIAPWLRYRHPPEHVARLVMDTISKAERAADEHRQEVAGSVLGADQPVPD